MRSRVAIIVPMEGRIKAIIPYQEPKTFNRAWIKAVCGSGTRPEWNGVDKTWDIARGWFPDVLDAMLRRFGQVDIYEDHSEMERCNTNCLQASGHECTCSCGGKNHGGENRYSERRNWICIDEDTQALIGISQRKRFHYVVKPESFQPIRERQSEGFQQYRFAAHYKPELSSCPSCGNFTYLVVDHCHIHGWIRSRICTRCNIRHGRIEKSFRHGDYYLTQEQISQHEYVIAQLAQCPDCKMLIAVRNNIEFVEET